MHFTTIPDDEIFPDHHRILMRGSEDQTADDRIADVEMQVYIEPESGLRIFRARCVLDPGDLKRLGEGEAFWLSLWGHVVPFDVSMTVPVEEVPDGSAED